MGHQASVQGLIDVESGHSSDSIFAPGDHAENSPDEWHAESGGKRPPEGRSGRAKRELQRGEDALRERLSESRQVGRYGHVRIDK